MDDRQARLDAMMETLERRGITDPRVLDALREVPRDAFVPPERRGESFADSPVAIEEGQTVSQPFIVALMAAALRLRGDERVLDVGTGSGYAAAVLGRLAREVHSIERIGSLADSAKERLARLGFANVHVERGDGSVGLARHAPFDAISVAAGGPAVPQALLSQLAIGGRLVMPVGARQTSQVLVRVTRESDMEFRRESLGEVRFVPLIGEAAWREAATEGDAAPERAGVGHPVDRSPPRAPARGLSTLVREAAVPLGDLERDSLDALVDRIGDARVVLLGESTHGTSEFYRMRARITRELVERRGFDFVAVEADWPDAARIDEYVLGGPRRLRHDFTPFSRFPTWMWRNAEFHRLADWLRAYNAAHPRRRVGFHGLDLYSLFTSIAAVLAYLDEVDPDAAAVARGRYEALRPWRNDPAAYGMAVMMGRARSVEDAVIAMLRDMLARRVDYARTDGDRFFDAAGNARLVADAERYYRAMYRGSIESWNLRDAHMFDTLSAALAFHGPASRGVVWAHNSHVGNALATEMAARGEHNVGQLCRAHLGSGVYIVGFGTDHGAVAAARAWDGPVQRMNVIPARTGSYEHVFHASGIPAFMLDLQRHGTRDALGAPLLERAIGVVYKPESELQSHYFRASLPAQFDEFVWFDETEAVRPLPSPTPRLVELPETYPFGL